MIGQSILCRGKGQLLVNNSSTEIFYSLLDLDNNQQGEVLAQLQQTQPLVYQQVSRMLGVENKQDYSLTGVFADTAAQVFQPVCFAGLVLDKYLIGEQIGQGGMGLVYAATRTEQTYQQELAVKFIQPSLTQVLGQQALYQEAQLLALLNHPCIAKVFDAGEHQGYVYMVMEKIQGQELNEYLTTNTLSIKSKLQLFTKVCDAIEHAHQNQILHGDIKPENVLIDTRGEPKVFDFNITQTRLPHHAPASSVKAFSKLYASPEQQRGEHLTQQSDVFSLGKLLVAMLAADPINKELALVLDKATSERPEQRYQNVGQLRMEVENYIQARPLVAKKHTFVYLLQKLLQRRPLTSGLLTVLALSLCSFSLLLLQKNQQLLTQQGLTEDMVLELTDIVFHGKVIEHQGQFEDMLELTRRKVLANQDLPTQLKRKMLMAMITPVPEKQVLQAKDIKK